MSKTDMDEQVHPHTTKTPPAIAGVVVDWCANIFDLFLLRSLK
jgi:hypothetical protein